MRPFAIQEAVPGDIDEILGIEGVSHATPWPRESFQAEMDLPQALLLVARESTSGPARLLGYLSAWVVDTEVHVLNVTVHPAFRGQGVGGALLARAEEAGVERGGSRAFLDVRRSNAAAISLYRRAGYTPIGVRRRYYSDNDEDAIVMSRPLVADPDEALP